MLIKGKEYPVKDGYVTVDGKKYVVLDNPDWMAQWRKIRKMNEFEKGKK